MSKCLPADMPVGFRFEPKVEEIIFHYLWLKSIGKDSEVDLVIRELNFYHFDPWDLSGTCFLIFFLFFFSLRLYIYIYIYVCMYINVYCLLLVCLN